MKKILLALLIFGLAITGHAFSLASSSLAPTASPSQQTEIIVNDKKIDNYPYTINNCTLVPAKAVSNALGFTISWDGQTQSATIKGNYMESTVTVGQDSYVATSIVAIGMTKPTSFGSGPILINDTLYVPAELFRIMQGNNPEAVKIVDNQVIINRIDK